MSDNPEVEIVADGTNRLTLVFPEGTELEGGKKMTVEDVSKILRGAEDAEVEGQGSRSCRFPSLICRYHCSTNTAVSLRG